MLSGGRAFVKWLGHECSALMIGISVLIKEILERSSPFPSSEDLIRSRQFVSQKRAFTRIQVCQHHDLELWISRTVLSVPSLKYFVIAVQRYWDRSSKLPSFSDRKMEVTNWEFFWGVIIYGDNQVYSFESMSLKMRTKCYSIISKYFDF